MRCPGSGSPSKHRPSNSIIVEHFLTYYGGTIAMVVARLIDEVDRHEQELATANHELIQRNREAESANRLKGEILANLSHEFRTPLNGILGMADLLQMGDEDAERRVWIAELQTLARHLDQVLARMLDFVALGEGKSPLRADPFSLSEVVDATVAGFHALSGAKDLHRICTPDQELPALVVGDGNRLRQLLTELLNNAINHTAQGEIACRLSPEKAPEHDPRYWVRIALSDTGCGIGADMLERFFDPFVQIETAQPAMSAATASACRCVVASSP